MANWKALTLISITIGLLGLIIIIVLFTATGGYVPFDYGIVLDAGSSHTQVTLYHWLADKNRCTGVVEQLATCRIEDGISSYNLSDTKSVGEDLLNCVQNVSLKIEKGRTFKTPLYLGATAGMRLLNITAPNSVTTIFYLIKSVLQLKSGLQTKTIDIISGQNEGLYSWVTNNYLMDKLIVDKFDDKSANATIGMLDMGGASAQIAYRTNSKSKKSGSLDSNEVNVRLYGINHTVKASSNLCFGVNQAMLRYQKYLILTWDKYYYPVIDNPCLPIGSNLTISGNQFKDQICVKTKKGINDIDYNKSYTFNGISSADQCSHIVNKQLLNKSKCEEMFDLCFDDLDSSPPEETQFYALSSYYYTTGVLNLTEQMSIQTFNQSMTNFCNSDRTTLLNNSLVNPLFVNKYCFQLNYIYATIKNVYKFTDKMWQNIRFANTIKNTQLGWSLGFMINATNAIAAEKPTPPVVQLFPFILVTTFCTLILLFSIYFALKWVRKSEEERKDPYLPISGSPTA